MTHFSLHTRLVLLLAVGAGTMAPRAAAAEPDTATDAGANTEEVVEGPRLTALLAEIGKARRGVTSMRASFTQERTLTLLATSVKSNGQLFVVAPDRIRWELAAPDDVVYWVGPEGLAYRSKSGGATAPKSANVGRALADVRALLTGDIAALGERYVLRGTRNATTVTILGDARDARATVKSFRLVLDKGLVLPRSARLVEGKSDTIDLVFSNAAVNVPVDPALMRP